LFFALVALTGLMEAGVLAEGMTLINRALGGGFVSNAEFAAYLESATDIDNSYKGAALGLAIAFIAWLSRTVENVPPLGGGTPHDSPRWAIAWWFVPIAFLWKPYTIVSDAWRRLGTSVRRSGSTLVVIWWLGFVGSTILARYVAAASDLADVNELNTLFTIGLIGDLVATGSAVCGLLVVREIQSRASERAEAAGLDAPRGVWPGGISARLTVGSPTPPPAAGSHCSGCGVRRTATGRFCASCGTDLGGSTTAA
jgi:Domain of unknown function (DUF4328)